MRWWERHLSECGTAYRGCAPGCQKDEVEEYAKSLARDAVAELVAAAKNVSVFEFCSDLDDGIPCMACPVCKLHDAIVDAEVE